MPDKNVGLCSVREEQGACFVVGSRCVRAWCVGWGSGNTGFLAEGQVNRVWW